MPAYGVVAFYRENRSEIVAVAEIVCKIYRLQLSVEKLPETTDMLPALLPEETVLCILNAEGWHTLKLLKYIYALPRPVLLVRPDQAPETYCRLKVPVGYLPENKEKVMWVNFFQHNHPESETELIVPREKDEGIAAQVRTNVGFIERIFRQSGARYVETSRPGSFEKNLEEVFRESNDCIVFIMRPFRIFSCYVPRTLRLFRKYAHTATLIIPRDDSLYIPCH